MKPGDTVKLGISYLAWPLANAGRRNLRTADGPRFLPTNVSYTLVEYSADGRAVIRDGRGCHWTCPLGYCTEAVPFVEVGRA